MSVALQGILKKVDQPPATVPEEEAVKDDPSKATETNNTDTSETGPKNGTENKLPPLEKKFCQVCQVYVTGTKPFEAHSESKGHLKKLARSLGTTSDQVTPEAEDTKMISVSQEQLQVLLFCEVCSQQLNSVFQIKEHRSGNKHKNNLARLTKPVAPVARPPPRNDNGPFRGGKVKGVGGVNVNYQTQQKEGFAPRGRGRGNPAQRGASSGGRGGRTTAPGKPYPSRGSFGGGGRGGAGSGRGRGQARDPTQQPAAWNTGSFRGSAPRGASTQQFRAPGGQRQPQMQQSHGFAPRSGVMGNPRHSLQQQQYGHAGPVEEAFSNVDNSQQYNNNAQQWSTNTETNYQQSLISGGFVESYSDKNFTNQDQWQGSDSYSKQLDPRLSQYKEPANNWSAGSQQPEDYGYQWS